MAEPNTPTTPASIFSLLGDSATQPPSPSESTPARYSSPVYEALAGQAPVGVTGAEKLSAIGTGTLTGLPTGALVSGATIEGARRGLTMTRSPYGALVGGVVGLASGLFGASRLSPLLESNVPPKYLQDPALIPYFQGGKTFGEAIGAAPTVFRIPTMQGGRVANFISSMGDEARRAPKGTLAAETVTGLGSATAGAFALSYDPSNELLRGGAEVVGGMFNPLRTLSTAARNSQGVITNVMGRFSESGRENAAAKYLQNIINQAGEDPQELVRLLNEALPSGVPEPTAGQKTGSLALNVVERTLGRQNPAFGSQLGPQGMQTFDALTQLADRLRAIGEPEALTAAARIESDFFQGLLSNRMTVAEQNAAQSIRRISPRSAQPTEEVGRIISDEVFASLDDAREYGDALWKQAELEAVDVTPGERGLSDAVITPRRMQGQNSSRGIMEAMTSVSPEYLRSMPGASTARRIANRFGVTPGTMETYNQGKLSMPYLQSEQVPANYVTGVQELSVSDMIKARSDLLKLARVHVKTDPNAARIYGEMAESIHADLDLLDFPAYDRARAYTRELNDFYSRTFAGDATATRRTGALALPPEVLVQRAFGSYTDVTFARMDQAMAAVEGLNTRYQRLLTELGPDAPQVLELKPFAERAAQGSISMRDAQQQWLLLGAQKSFKESLDENGNIVTVLDKNKLDNFIIDNRPYLAAAGLLADLQNASTAEATLRQVTEANSAFNKGVADQAAFFNVLGNKNINPTQTVVDALSSDNPVQQMRRLVALARNGGQNAVDGLKSIVYDYAFTAAGGNKGFSPTAYYESLFEPIRGIRNKPSIMNLMESSGLVSTDEISNVNRILRPMRTIEESLRSGQMVENALAQPKSPIEELAVSYLGSKLAAVGSGSAQSLVLAGRGASIARDMLLNKPSMLIQDVLQTAARDPRKMATLLQRITPQNQQELARRLASQFGITGYVAGLTGGAINPVTYEPVEQEPGSAFSSPYDQMYAPQPRPQPPAPSTRGSPVSPAPPPQSAAPQGSANPSSREMLQQLFPFDAMLGA
jgi:hypothetical protein